MVPAGTPSSVPVRADWLPPDDLPRADLREDFELGGVGINDPSQGLAVQVWRAWADGANVRVATAAGALEQVLFAGNPSELTLAFDQNMRPTVAYVQAGQCFLRWYDPVPAAMVVTGVEGAYSPFLTMDDKRDALRGTSDIVLAYLRGNACYYRVQRERYLTEHTLATGLEVGNSRITNFGMNRQNRLMALISTDF